MNYKRRNINPMVMMIILLIIMRIVRGDMGDPSAWIVSKLLMLPAILVGLSLHEFGHAIVSDRLGDPTPRAQGRVTANPIAHIDPMGLLCLILAGFGWGIPVQVNPGYYKHRRRDEALVAVAGVTMNLIIAFLSTIVLKVLISVSENEFIYSTVGSVIIDMLRNLISINVVLMVFNLLPIPPLDGFNILTQIFDLSKYSWYRQVYNNGGIILIALVLFGGTRLILSPLVSLVYGLFLKILVM